MNSRIRNKSVEIFLFCQCFDTEGTDNILFRGWLDYQGVNEFAYEYTKAHELGHGAYRLRHTFSEENRYREERGKTSNLMDYVPAARAREAEELKKYQWDYIHDPESIWFVWLEKEEEGELKKLTGNRIVYVGDSLINDKKVFINEKVYKKIYLKYEPETKDTTKYINVRIVYKPDKETSYKYNPEKDFQRIEVNTKYELTFDSLSEGRYLALFKDKNKKIDTVKFYIRKKKYDFACEVCGRDLTITLDKLKLIFPNNKDLNQNHVNYLNET